MSPIDWLFRWQVLGCDGILGSNHVQDKCLRCLSPDESDSDDPEENMSCQPQGGTVVPYPLLARGDESNMHMPTAC